MKQNSRAFRPTVDQLETLALLSVVGIPGVSVSSMGTLGILAPAGSGHNSAVVSIDPANHDVKVTVNFGSGVQSVEFNPTVTHIYNVAYLGGTQGFDTFTDDTSLISREYGYGSGNNFTGGTNINYVWFLGTTLTAPNTYNTQGAHSVSDV